jgi:hypothetical protein
MRPTFESQSDFAVFETFRAQCLKQLMWQESFSDRGRIILTIILHTYF